MRIIRFAEIEENVIHDSVVTIGNFDGVHLGHREIFRRLVACGSDRGLQSVVVTFEPHPLKVLSAEAPPPMITTFEQKAALIESANVDYLVVVPFTTEFACMTADDFVRNVLFDSIDMRHIVIGHDYAFGKGREGNYQTLERIGAEMGFTLEDMEPVSTNGMVYSSSLARRLIASGAVDDASAVLGRYHFISGFVVHGRDIGHIIGFPTANISTSNELLPPDGVYAVMVSMKGELLKGACSIGLNPTFDNSTRSVEVFMLDFSGQVYGRELLVFFVKRLRSLVKFSDASALAAAISIDVQHTREVLEMVELNLVNSCVTGVVLNEI